MIPLLGCSMITEPPPESLVKAAECGTEPAPYTSQLHIAIHSETVLPEYLAAIVNSIVVDECATGSPNRYLFKRHNDHNATLILYAWEDSPVTQMFFDENGLPYVDPEYTALISGRPACDADKVEIQQIQRPITWTPVHPSDECGVGPAGYIGFKGAR